MITFPLQHALPKNTLPRSGRLPAIDKIHNIEETLLVVPHLRRSIDRLHSEVSVVVAKLPVKTLAAVSGHQSFLHYQLSAKLHAKAPITWTWSSQILFRISLM
jgi:hypothetical protein